MKIRSISQKEFISGFIQKKEPVSLFLGAGASFSSNIPMASQLTWEFKKEIYCRNNNVSTERYKDMTLKSAKETIQNYFSIDVNNPSLGSIEEYSYYFEKYLPLPKARQEYIRKQVEGKEPSIGYLCLATLIDIKAIDRVYTTNFDDLVRNACNIVNPLHAVCEISETKGDLQNISDDSPCIVKLHGDYKYDFLKNTATELQQINAALGDYFAKKLSGRTLMVIGYSGNDDSIMGELESKIAEQYFASGGIIWFKIKGSQLGARTAAFMERACEINPNSCIVDIDGFDQLLSDLYSSKAIKNEVIEKRLRATDANLLPLNFNINSDDTLVRINAFLSKDVVFECKAFSAKIASWEELRATVNGTDIIAGLSAGRVLAFATEKEIFSCFGDKLQSEIETIQIPFSKLRRDYSVQLGMYYELISRSLIAQGFQKYGGFKSRKFYDINSLRAVQLNYQSYNVYEAIEIGLVFINRQFALTILPTVVVKNEKLDYRQKGKIANSIMSNRRNQEVDKALTEWTERLVTKDDTDTISFEVGTNKMIFNKHAVMCGGKKYIKADRFNRYQLIEPKLAFDIAEGTKGFANQLKGLIASKPLDTHYGDGCGKPIQLALLSLNTETDKIIAHLNSLNGRCDVGEKEQYLPTYLGFENVFGKELIVPQKNQGVGNDYLFEYQKSFLDQCETAIDFLTKIKLCIDRISFKSLEFDVLILYYPTGYGKFRQNIADGNNYDFHDSIKLYCADKGVKVQIIEERSTKYADKAKVMWALSTSLYTKANGELWRPKNYDNDTAYIGITYSVGTENKYYLGCSQLFDSAGRGMKLVLRQLKNPTLIGLNPFMSKDDAYSMMCELRDAYYKMTPINSLKRIVIHKTTRFTYEEIEGINRAFQGVDNIELIQIQEYCQWRAVPYIWKVDKQKNIADGYPIKRGSVIPIDDRSILLWTHGNIKLSELNGNSTDFGNYYKGGRGIPAPLLIKRYQGKSSGEIIAQEILMLTKMNFNSGDSLYKLLPVTLDYAKLLSKIAKQNTKICEQTYDFRLFM